MTKARETIDWNVLYKGNTQYWEIPENIFSQMRALLPEHPRVLDVGCGRGNLVARFSTRGVIVLGIDASRVAINEAIRNYPHCSFLVVDIETTPSIEDLGFFDMAIFHLSIAFIRSKRSTLRKIKRITPKCLVVTPFLFPDSSASDKQRRISIHQGVDRIFREEFSQVKILFELVVNGSLIRGYLLE